MARKNPSRPVQMGFEATVAQIAVSQIQPLRIVSDAVKKTPKYARIVASIREVGIVEPPVVTHDRAERGKYLLLDGHLRIEVLKDMGVPDVACLISTDDEAFTYNRRINRLAIIQEHRMILKAIERGVSEERIAKVLDLDVGSIQRRRRLLDGICPEAANLLKDKHVSMQTIWELKRLLPLRQIEAAELMVAMNKYTVSYAKSLVAATPQSQIVESRRPKIVPGLTDDQVALMERESANLDREFKLIEQTYGTDHLELVLAKGFLGKLLGNPRVVRYLAQRQQELLSEFQRLMEMHAG